MAVSRTHRKKNRLLALCCVTVSLIVIFIQIDVFRITNRDDDIQSSAKKFHSARPPAAQGGGFAGQLERPNSKPSKLHESTLIKELPCAKYIKNIAVSHPKLSAGQKDLFQFLASQLTNHALSRYEEDSRNIPLWLKSAAQVKQRLNNLQQCWDREPAMVGESQETVSELPSLAICTVQHSSGPFIQEWIAHHLLMGARKVIIYDNSPPSSASSQHFQLAVRPFVDAGYAEIVKWYFPKGDAYRQTGAINDCIKKNRNSYDWIGVFDTDEYPVINPPQSICLTHFLADRMLEKQGSLAIRWRGFSPLGVFQHDHTKLFLEQYRQEVNYTGEFGYVKHIVNTQRVIDFTDPHLPRFRRGYLPQDSHGRVVTKSVSDDVPADDFEHIELRHYWARDLRSGVMDKVCGATKERASYMERRAEILMNLVSPGCCKPIPDTPTRHESFLRQFMYAA
ncbi:hypothetical protein DFS34DRAFT_110656 [Phlyctochytrium arcticum]|nr:hypothetical protein DFS34DRAFT_110656 [Phlyctochytrium arcticum]